MKKINNLVKILCLSLIFIFTGCEEVPEKGIYKEGTYFGYDHTNESNLVYTTTAVVYIDEYGMIKSVFIDSTFSDTPGVLTTKKFEADSYELYNPDSKEFDNISIPEWKKQVKLIEDAVVREQGINFIKWTDETKTTSNSISGVKMPIGNIYTALDNALNQAK